jgi:hypothetical protein
MKPLPELALACQSQRWSNADDVGLLPSTLAQCLLLSASPLGTLPAFDACQLAAVHVNGARQPHSVMFACVGVFIPSYHACCEPALHGVVGLLCTNR